MVGRMIDEWSNQRHRIGFRLWQTDDSPDVQ